MPDQAPPNLSPAELTRYSRHILLDEVGLQGQQRLAAAKVLIIGAGGLGSPASMYLAAAGVGTIGMADFDRVEEHNLHRQLLHHDADIGTPKLDSAARSLREINPNVAIQLHPEGITPDNARDIFSGYDVVVDGTDNFSTRYLNNDAAFFTRKPLVYGSIFKFEGQVSVFDPHSGAPCYRCLFPEPPPPGSIPTCGEAGVIGALCGVIGSIQAMEAIKCIVGFGEPLKGRVLSYNALRQSFQTLNLQRDRGCPLCGDHPRIPAIEAENYTYTCDPDTPMSDDGLPPIEISVQEANELLATRPNEVLLIDVREPYELEIAKIAGALPIPMRQVPERLAELPKDKHLLIHCHHGGRSMRVTEYLRSQGYAAVTNVAGGIDEWAQSIEPGLRRY